MKEFFLRCDDVTAPDRAFLRVYGLVKAAGLPLSCAVIPAGAVPELAAFLRREAAAGARVETLEHGLAHAEHSGNRYLKHEFGPSRAYAVQRADMAEGRRLMRVLFGRLFTPVFVPPFHIFNSDTLRAAAALRIRAVSASRMPPGPRPPGLVFLPTRVTVNEYDLQLRPRPLDADLLRSRTLAALREKGPAGIYFHHADLRAADLKVFSSYLALLAGLRDRGLAAFRTCGELIKKRAV